MPPAPPRGSRSGQAREWRATAFREERRRLLARVSVLLRRVRGLEHAAWHDPLTGLANRAWLHAELERSLARVPKGDARTCVMHIDLDRFKEVNDTLGHGVGDAVLREAARRMTATLPRGAVVARVGGDEFVVVLDLPGPDAEAHVHRIAERLIADLRVPMTIGDSLVRVGASVGFAFAGVAARSADLLICDADIALYESKRAGKGIATSFTAAMRGALEARHARLHAVEHALETGAIEPQVQPVLRLADRAPLCLAMLPAWTDPARGSRSAAEFLETVEEIGARATLDRRLAEAGLDALALLHDRGAAVSVSVPVAARTLDTPEFTADLELAITMRRLPAARFALVLEAGSFAPPEAERRLRFLAPLLQRGIALHLAVDAAGATPLAALARPQITTVRFDLGACGGHASPVSGALAGLGRDLGFDVTATGLDTAADVEAAARLGCRAGQGDALAPLRPLSDLDALVPIAPGSAAAHRQARAAGSAIVKTGSA